jgi:hypothetical protein
MGQRRAQKVAIFKPVADATLDRGEGGIAAGRHAAAFMEP